MQINTTKYHVLPRVNEKVITKVDLTEKLLRLYWSTSQGLRNTLTLLGMEQRLNLNALSLVPSFMNFNQKIPKNVFFRHGSKFAL